MAGLAASGGSTELQFGDEVSFSPVLTEGHLAASFINGKCYPVVAVHETHQVENGIITLPKEFERCVFTILRPTEDQSDARIQNVMYGNSIRLGVAGEYVLRVSTADDSDYDDGMPPSVCLVPFNPDLPPCISETFRVLPKGRVREEGEIIRVGEQIILESIVTGTYVAVGQSFTQAVFSTLPYDACLPQGRSIELISQPSIEAVWLIEPFDLQVNEPELSTPGQVLRVGDTVVLFHKEFEAFLEGVPDHEGGHSVVFSTVKPPKATYSVRDLDHPSGAVWLVESNNIVSGGPIFAAAYQFAYRLRHLASGKYLCCSSPSLHQSLSSTIDTPITPSRAKPLHQGVLRYRLTLESSLFTPKMNHIEDTLTAFHPLDDQDETIKAGGYARLELQGSTWLHCTTDRIVNANGDHTSRLAAGVAPKPIYEDLFAIHIAEPMIAPSLSRVVSIVPLLKAAAEVFSRPETYQMWSDITSISTYNRYDSHASLRSSFRDTYSMPDGPESAELLAAMQTLMKLDLNNVSKMEKKGSDCHSGTSRATTVRLGATLSSGAPTVRASGHVRDVVSIPVPPNPAEREFIASPPLAPQVDVESDGINSSTCSADRDMLGVLTEFDRVHSEGAFDRTVTGDSSVKFEGVYHSAKHAAYCIAALLAVSASAACHLIHRKNSPASPVMSITVHGPPGEKLRLGERHIDIPLAKRVSSVNSIKDHPQYKPLKKVVDAPGGGKVKYGTGISKDGSRVPGPPTWLFCGKRLRRTDVMKAMAEQAKSKYHCPVVAMETNEKLRATLQRLKKTSQRNALKRLISATTAALADLIAFLVAVPQREGFRKPNLPVAPDRAVSAAQGIFVTKNVPNKKCQVILYEQGLHHLVFNLLSAPFTQQAAPPEAVHGASKSRTRQQGTEAQKPAPSPDVSPTAPPAAAGGKSLVNLTEISSKKYEMLHIILRLGYRLVMQLAAGNPQVSDDVCQYIGFFETQSGYRLNATDTIHAIVYNHPDVLKSLKDETIRRFVRLVPDYGRSPSYLNLLSAVCVCQGHGIQRTQDLVCAQVLALQQECEEDGRRLSEALLHRTRLKNGTLEISIMDDDDEEGRKMNCSVSYHQGLVTPSTDHLDKSGAKNWCGNDWVPLQDFIASGNHAQVRYFERQLNFLAALCADNPACSAKVADLVPRDHILTALEKGLGSISSDHSSGDQPLGDAVRTCFLALARVLYLQPGGKGTAKVSPAKGRKVHGSKGPGAALKKRWKRLLCDDITRNTSLCLPRVGRNQQVCETLRCLLLLVESGQFSKQELKRLAPILCQFLDPTTDTVTESHHDSLYGKSARLLGFGAVYGKETGLSPVWQKAVVEALPDPMDPRFLDNDDNQTVMDCKLVACQLLQAAQELGVTTTQWVEELSIAVPYKGTLKGRHSLAKILLEVTMYRGNDELFSIAFRLLCQSLAEDESPAVMKAEFPPNDGTENSAVTGFASIIKQDVVPRARGLASKRENSGIVVQHFVNHFTNSFEDTFCVCFMLRVFTYLITSEKDKGGEKAMAVMQSNLDRLGCTLLMSSLIEAPNETIVEHALIFGIAQLEQGNRQVQTQLMNYYYDTSDEAFFQCIRNRLHKAVQELKELEMNEKRRGQPMDHAGMSLHFPLSPVRIQPDSKLSCVTKTLRLLQLFCEGHNHELQLYIHMQPDNPHPVDLVKESLMVLRQLILVPPHCYEKTLFELLLQCFNSLTEYCQGPCKENQEALVNAHLAGEVGKVLETKYEEATQHRITREQTDEVQNAATITLLSLLEGCEDAKVPNTLMQTTDLMLLIGKTLDLCWRNRKRGSAENNDTALELGFNLFIFMETLSSFDAHHLLQDSNFYMTNEAGFQYFQSMTGRIEIAGREGRLQRVYFRIPELCLNLSENTKKAILWSADRDTPAARLSSFFNMAADALFEMRFNDQHFSSKALYCGRGELKQGNYFKGFLSVLAVHIHRNARTIHQVTVYIAVVMAFLNAASLEDESYGFAAVALIYALGFVQLLLTTMNAVHQAVSEGPILAHKMNKEERRAGKFTARIRLTAEELLQLRRAADSPDRREASPVADAPTRLNGLAGLDRGINSPRRRSTLTPLGSRRPTALMDPNMVVQSPRSGLSRLSNSRMQRLRSSPLLGATDKDFQHDPELVFNSPRIDPKRRDSSSGRASMRARDGIARRRHSIPEPLLGQQMDMQDEDDSGVLSPDDTEQTKTTLTRASFSPLGPPQGAAAGQWNGSNTLLSTMSRRNNNNSNNSNSNVGNKPRGTPMSLTSPRERDFSNGSSTTTTLGTMPNVPAAKPVAQLSTLNSAFRLQLQPHVSDAVSESNSSQAASPLPQPFLGDKGSTCGSVTPFSPLVDEESLSQGWGGTMNTLGTMNLGHLGMPPLGLGQPAQHLKSPLYRKQATPRPQRTPQLQSLPAGNPAAKKGGNNAALGPPLELALKRELNAMLVAQHLSTDGRFLGHCFMVLCSVLGLFLSPLFFTPQLFSIVSNSPLLQSVIRSITKNGKSLLLTGLLAVIIVYHFAIIGHVFFRDSYHNSSEAAATIFRTFIHTLFNGIASGGISDLMDPPTFDADGDGHVDPMWGLRMGFDFSFFVIVIVILLNIIFGIIIDTFAELRAEKQKVEEEIRTRCFICGIESSEFDRHASGFDCHIRRDHNMWCYIYFIHHLRTKEESEFTGQESYVWNKMENLDLTFFPSNKAICLQNKSGVETGGEEKRGKGLLPVNGRMDPMWEGRFTEMWNEQKGMLKKMEGFEKKFRDMMAAVNTMHAEFKRHPIFGYGEDSPHAASRGMVQRRVSGSSNMRLTDSQYLNGAESKLVRGGSISLSHRASHKPTGSYYGHDSFRE
ncbi:Inositol 1 [Diplonema papillatum]|nr:Inositol 1 [Diplonema papillatum]